MVDPATFRSVLAQWPSGVTVVTTLVDGVRHGMTASSFSSVSLDPPLVSVCLDRALYSHELIAASGVFGVNVLAKDQAEVARRFAGMVPDLPDRFAGESWTTAHTGVPLLDSALGWLDCRVVHEYPGGDHTIFVGEVLAGHAARAYGAAALPLAQLGPVRRRAARPTRRSRTAAWSPRCAPGTHPVSAIFDTVHELAAAGVRVRLLDLTSDEAPTGRPRGARAERDRPGRHRRRTATSALDARPRGRRGRPRPRRPRRPGPGAGHRRPTSRPGWSSCSRTRSPPSAPTTCSLPWSALSAAGVAEIGLSETGDSATPLRVRALLQDAVGLARPVPLRVHLRDHDRLGLVKALTALKSGVTHFDTTLAGLDGTVATEDLVRLFGGVEVDSPADADRVAQAAAALRLALAPTDLSLKTPPPAEHPISRPHRPRRTRRSRRMTAKLTAEYLLPDLTDAERERAERVESVLPAIAAAAESADEAACAARGPHQAARPTPACSAWSCPRSTAASAAGCATSRPRRTPSARSAARPRWRSSSTAPRPRAACCRWRRSTPASTTTRRRRSCAPSPRRCCTSWAPSRRRSATSPARRSRPPTPTC